MNDAAGLFHKAAILSGSTVRAIEPETAAGYTAAITESLGLQGAGIEALRRVPVASLLAASQNQPLGAVVDGKVLPSHPFDPATPGWSTDIPLLIGSTAEEGTIFLMMDPSFPDMDEERLLAAAGSMVGADRAESFLDFYRCRTLAEPPGYLLAGIMTHRFFTMPALQIADLRAQCAGAPVFLYDLAWRTPVLDGKLRAAHGIDMPLWFDNAERAGGLVGEGADALLISRMLSEALVAFARNGMPHTDRLPPWPAYDRARRTAMIFDAPPRTEAHFASDLRDFWQNSGVQPAAGLSG